MVLFNFGPSEFPVRRGDRIAQLIIERYAVVQLEEVGFGFYAPDPLAPTLRGAQGFGSTGLNTPDRTPNNAPSIRFRRTGIDPSNSTPASPPVDPRSLDGTTINSEVLRRE